MGVIIGVIVGYVMGTKSGEQGLEELKDAWKTIRSSEEARDIRRRSVNGRQPHQQRWWVAGRAPPTGGQYLALGDCAASDRMTCR